MTIMYMMIIAAAVTAIFMTKSRNIRILMQRMISINIMPIAVVDAVTAIPIHKSMKKPKLIAIRRSTPILMRTEINMYMMTVAVVDAVTAMPIHMSIKKPKPTVIRRSTPILMRTAHNMYTMPVAVVDAVTPTRMTPTPTTLIRTIVTIPMRTTATAPIPTTLTPTRRPIPRRCLPCRKASRSVSIFLTT